MTDDEIRAKIRLALSHAPGFGQAYLTTEVARDLGVKENQVLKVLDTMIRRNEVARQGELLTCTRNAA